MPGRRGKETEFERGYLEIDFPSAPFDSAWQLLVRSARVYFSNFIFLAAVTLVVFLPGKAALQLAFYWLDVSKSGIIAYAGMDLSDLVLGALSASAAIYGLLEYFRSGRAAPLGPSLRWGLRQWPKMVWTQFKVEVTITLWGAVFLIPGIVAMVRLVFTEPLVAIEGDRENEVLSRSRELSRGRGWLIFAVMAPVLIVELAAPFLVLNAIGGTSASRPVMALVDSLLSVGGQWATVIVLLMYLGTVPARQTSGVGNPARGRRLGHETP